MSRQIEEAAMMRKSAAAAADEEDCGGNSMTKVSGDVQFNLLFLLVWVGVSG